MRKMRIAAAVVGMGLGYGGMAKAAVFEGLGFLQGTNNSFVKGVSADGSTVVGASADDLGLQGLVGGYMEAFRWTQSGGMQGLGDLPGGANLSIAFGTSADGSVVAGFGSSQAGEESFRWSVATGMVQVNPVAPYQNGAAFAISRDGLVVTGEVVRASKDFQPYQWSSGSGTTLLGTLPGYITVFPNAASGDGSVVVGVAENSDNSSHIGFRWTAVGGMEALPIPSGASAEAQVISADGHVIAGYVADFQSSKHFAGLAIWHDDGTLDEVQGIRALADVHAGGITPDGSIIVGSIPPGDAAGPTHAFIWDEVNGMRDLNFVLPEEYGVDLQGWLLNSADGISDDGRVIAGKGTDPEGRLEAWVVVLPEPSVILLLLSGTLLLRRRGWKMRLN